MSDLDLAEFLPSIDIDVEACVAWQEKFDCYFCALGSPPHAEDCPLVVGGFIEQSGERVK